MERHGKLLILGLLALGLAIGAWFVFAPPSQTGANESSLPTEVVQEAATQQAIVVQATASETSRIARSEVEAAAAPAATDAEIDAAMAKLIGRVVEFDGKPAAARLVRLFRVDPQVLFRPELSVLGDPIADLDGAMAGETTTGADGRFELPGVWPHSMYLVKADVGGTNPTIKLASRTPSPGAVCDLGDIVLKNGAVVTGRVVDESGDPIAGAQVRAADLPAIMTQFVPVELFEPEGFVIGGQATEAMVVEMPAWVRKYWDNLPLPTATTDADGKFKLTGIEPGLNMVAATKSGLVAAVQKGVKLDPGQVRELGKLVLREGETAAGRVVDRAGKPVAGAEVIVGPKLPGIPMTLTRPAVTSNAQGKFELPGQANGDVIAAVRRGKGDRWMISEPQSVQKDLVLTLPSRHTLTLQLLSEPGLALASTKLRLVAASSEETQALPVMAALGFAREVPLAERTTKLPDGRMQIRDLDAGVYMLIASAAGHAHAQEKLELTADRELQLRLPAESGFDVTVVDGRGAGVRNASAYVQAKRSGPDEMPFHAGRTDAAGKLRVRVPPGEGASVQVQHPRYGTVAADVQLPATAPVVLTFQDPGSIRGVITDAGKPPTPGKFTVSVRRPWEQIRGPIGAMPLLSMIDLDGKFAFEGLQPGEWHVEVIKSLDAIGSFSSMTQMMMVSWTGEQLPEQDVVVTAGGTTQVQLDLGAPRVVDGPSARISGTAFVDGRPAEGMIVHGWSRQRVSGTVDGSGRFDLGQVPEGSIWLQLIDAKDMELGPRSGSLWQKSVDVKGGADQTLTIEVATGSMAGAVVSHDGKPAANVQVHAEGQTAERVNSSARTFTDASGKFELKRIPAGKYTLTAQSDEMGRASVSVTVTAGVRTDAVQVQMARTYRIKGTVEVSRLKFKDDEQQWIWLTFAPANGASGNQPGASVDRKTGAFEIDGILVGAYRVHLHFNGEGDWQHESTLEVTGDMQGVKIVPTQIERTPATAPKK